MKKIIPLTAFLTLILPISSCRQNSGYDDEEITIHQKSIITKKQIDSVSVLNYNENGTQEDPPPKNGHQWKHIN